MLRNPLPPFPGDPGEISSPATLWASCVKFGEIPKVAPLRSGAPGELCACSEAIPGTREEGGLLAPTEETPPHPQDLPRRAAGSPDGRCSRQPRLSRSSPCWNARLSFPFPSLPLLVQPGSGGRSRLGAGNGGGRSSPGLPMCSWVERATLSLCRGLSKAGGVVFKAL